MGVALQLLGGEAVEIWEYSCNKYTEWRKIECGNMVYTSLRFSPDQTSLLGHSGNILQAWRFQGLPKVHNPSCRQFAGISRCGKYVATAYESESTITIITLHSRQPPRVIDAGVRIKGLVLAGNVLLGVGLGKLMAWLCTIEGLADRTPGGGTIWTTSLLEQSYKLLRLSAEGSVGVIGSRGVDSSPPFDTVTFSTTTRKLLAHAHQDPTEHSFQFADMLCGRHYLLLHNLLQHDAPPEDSRLTPQYTLREGWITDSEGRRKLWIPVEWRASWDRLDWLPDVSTQFSMIGEKPVIVKF